MVQVCVNIVLLSIFTLVWSKDENYYYAVAPVGYYNVLKTNIKSRWIRTMT